MPSHAEAPGQQPHRLGSWAPREPSAVVFRVIYICHVSAFLSHGHGLFTGSKKDPVSQGLRQSQRPSPTPAARGRSSAGRRVPGGPGRAPRRWQPRDAAFPLASPGCVDARLRQLGSSRLLHPVLKAPPHQLPPARPRCLGTCVSGYSHGVQCPDLSLIVKYIFTFQPSNLINDLYKNRELKSFRESLPLVF